MTLESRNRILAVCVLVAVTFAEASADTVFIDTFNATTVVSPVQWTPDPNRPGDYDVSSGDYVLTPTSENSDVMSVEVQDMILGNVSVRTQVRTTEVQGSAGVFIRMPAHFLTDRQNYFAGIGWAASLQETVVFFGKNEPGDGQEFFGDFPVLPFDVRNEDAMLQLDAMGTEFRVWGWRAGDPMPDEPQIVAIDDTYSDGFIGIFSNNGSTYLGGTGESVSAFRFVHVATQSIRGPGMIGDVNGDGLWDVLDIDELTVRSAAGTGTDVYDLNNDTVIDVRDITIWTKDLFGSWMGDLNLDGEFNSRDLVLILAEGTYASDVDSVWSTGDFNGDGRTNSSDLVVALADGGYELGPRLATAAVPEPTSIALLCIGILIVVRLRRS